MRLYTKVGPLLLIASLVLACAKKEQLPSDEPPADSAQVVANVETDPGMLSGEYLVGDGNLLIVRVGDKYELRDALGEAYDVFYFQGKEDTLSVYSNQNKSITFKMNTGQKTGTYYAPGEQWPVEYIGEIP